MGRPDSRGQRISAEVRRQPALGTFVPLNAYKDPAKGTFLAGAQKVEVTCLRSSGRGQETPGLSGGVGLCPPCEGWGIVSGR